VLAHAFVARFEDEHPGGVPDRGEADCLESGVHEACVFEAIAAAAGGDDLGLQAFGVEPDGAAEENVKAFERDAGDVGLEDAGEDVIGRCAGASIIDACEVGV
jgi:hypothetical protein